MRGFTANIAEPFKIGLRPDDRNYINGIGLEALSGLVPTEYGLAEPESVSRPLTPTVSWPFPQIFKMDGLTMLADETGVSEVDESDWSTSAITTYDPAIPANTKAITSGGPWHVADFQKAWFMFNGASTVFRTNRDGFAGNAEKTYTQDSISINTGTNFKGRLVMAGFDSNEFFSADWQSFWSTLEDVTDIGFEPAFENDTNWYWYSSPGGGNMIWPFVKSIGQDGLATNTSYGSSRPFIVEWMHRLDHGFGPLPWKGTVYAALPLGDHLIMYGDNGIAALSNRSIGAGEVTAHLLGIQKLAQYGILSRGSVAGDNYGHVFLDPDGRLRLITPDLRITDLDYKEFLNPFVGSEVVITKQPQLSEYRISDGSTSYTLNKNGLSAITPNATSNIFAQGGNVVISSAAASSTCSFITSPINMNLEEQKTIVRVSCQFRNITSAKIRVHTRYTCNGSYTQSGWYNLNNEGVAMARVAGIDFKIEFSGTISSGAKFDRISVGYQNHDRRYRRESFNV